MSNPEENVRPIAMPVSRAPMQSDSINEIAAALAKAQGSMQNATMNRTNPHFKSKYADLSSVLDSIRAPLSASGLSIVQTMQSGERGMVLRTMLMHSSGQYIATEYPLQQTQRPHEMGSALTYARRYSISALVCNSADEDDDGNSAMASPPKPNGPNGNGNGEKRQNSHVAHDTMPDDLLDVPEQEVIERDDGIQVLTVDAQRPIFSELQNELNACGTVDECKRWAIRAKSRASRLSGNWHKMLQAKYIEHLRSIEKRDALEYVDKATA